MNILVIIGLIGCITTNACALRITNIHDEAIYVILETPGHIFVDQTIDKHRFIDIDLASSVQEFSQHMVQVTLSPGYSKIKGLPNAIAPVKELQGTQELIIAPRQKDGNLSIVRAAGPITHTEPAKDSLVTRTWQRVKSFFA